MRAPRQSLMACMLLMTMPAFAQMSYESYIGAWRGPVQFHTSVAGQRDPASHQVAQAVIEVAPDGQVRGIVNDTGCKLLGLAREFVTPKQGSSQKTEKKAR